MTRARWLTLIVVSAGTALLLLDVTVVNVALPAIEQDLDASFSALQWVIDAYALMLAATLLAAGALADRFGRRAVFMGGLALFTACSVLCGLATSGALLDVARAAQGAGAAGMFAASLALLAHEFQGAERTFALGVWGAITGAALAVGPLVGGLIIDGLGWRWVFLLNLPLGALLLAAARRVLRESRDPAASALDLPGMGLFALAGFAGTFALIRGNTEGWGSAAIVAAALLCAAALAGFVAVERRARAPMLPGALFRIPAFSGTAVVAFAQSVALYPLFLFLALYFQDVLGTSATGAGLRLLPITVVLFVVAPISGALSGRVRLRVPLVAGLLLIAAGLLLMRGVTATSAWTHLLPGFVVGGIAIGIISPALAAAMVGVLSVECSGLASGINNTFRQLGIAAGIAVFGAIYQHEIGVRGAAARTGEQVAAAARQGAIDGLNLIFLVAAIAAVAGACVAWPLLGDLRSGTPDAPAH